MTIHYNEFNQPVGATLSNWEKKAFPSEAQLEGQYTTLERLSRDHAAPLFTVFQKYTEPSQYTYLFCEYMAEWEAFSRFIDEKIRDSGSVCYVIVDKKTQSPLGMFSLMRIDQQSGVIEVGHVHFSEKLKRTILATEAHYLLASYVFDILHYRRYEWKCDSFNAPSIAAAIRLGFTYEGTFRKAVVYKNRSRDTNWYSMLEEEWPDRKKAFKKWLDGSNFDIDGKQIKRLEQFRM